MWWILQTLNMSRVSIRLKEVWTHISIRNYEYNSILHILLNTHYWPLLDMSLCSWLSLGLRGRIKVPQGLSIWAKMKKHFGTGWYKAQNSANSAPFKRMIYNKNRFHDMMPLTVTFYIRLWRDQPSVQMLFANIQIACFLYLIFFHQCFGKNSENKLICCSEKFRNMGARSS